MNFETYKQLAATSQSTVGPAVAKVGGYWPVNVALSQATTHLGEALTYLFASDWKRYTEELIGAFWLLSCIANQYCCELKKSEEKCWDKYKDKLENLVQSDLLLIAHTECAEMSRIVNRYENNNYTDDKPNLSIAIPIAQAQIALAVCIEACNFTIEERIEYRKSIVIAHKGRPDIPIHPRFDPATAESLMRFRNIANITKCPFAKSAKVWSTQPWQVSVSADEFLNENADTIRRFARICHPERFDGLVIEQFGIQTLEKLQSATKELLVSLGRFSQPSPMSKQIELKEWRYELVGVDVFVTIFSSIYPANHPRASHSPSSTMYFFQPQTSFKAKAAKEKETIRKAFAAAQQDYRPLIGKVKFEAQKYIKPLDLSNGCPVQWWTE